MNKHVKRFLMFMGPVTLLLVLIVVMYQFSHSPAEKTRKTQLAEMGQNLTKVTPGDFLEMNDGTICVVRKVWIDHAPGGARIVFWGPNGWSGENANLDNTELAAKVKKIICKCDIFYKSTKDKFIYQ